MKTSPEIVTDLSDLLANFQGREYSGTIDRDTQFFADLGFASIDAIILGETLEARYGRKIGFTQFLAEAMNRNAQDVTVGELADFLARQFEQDC